VIPPGGIHALRPRQYYLSLSTPTISDALDLLSLSGGCLGLRPAVMEHKIVGPAFPVRFVPIGIGKKGAGDFLDDVPSGGVVVINNGGRMYRTVWGDLMTRVAKRNGIAETVIDGVCRAVALIRELNYPIFTRGGGYSDRRGASAACLGAGEVTAGDISVHPQDIVIADDSGVLVVPKSRAEEVLRTAQDIGDREDRIKRMVEEGLGLKEARAREGDDKIGKL
jgi:4-hydroxy-4-methyl-2-oxoglutarate aldolase